MKDLSIPHPSKRNNNPLLPNSIRGCIIGKSNCGKTNLLMNLLLDKFDSFDYLDYDNLYIFAKSLHQPEYAFLIGCLKNGFTKEQILDCLANKHYPPKETDYTTSKGIKIQYFVDSEEIPDPSELNQNDKNLIIFDDVMLETQSKINDYYTRGRHNNIDCFYISQNYFKLPRQTIRENSNFFILFPQDQITLEHFHRDHCIDLEKGKFFELCSLSWADPFGFVVVDLSSSTKRSGRYRKMLTDFLV